MSEKPSYVELEKRIVELEKKLSFLKQTEENLKINEEKYRSLFTNEIDAISIFDIETKEILDVNDSFLKLYGYTREEALRLITDDVSAEPEKTKKGNKQGCPGWRYPGQEKEPQKKGWNRDHRRTFPPDHSNGKAEMSCMQ